jgi:hypothetical protein
MHNSQEFSNTRCVKISGFASTFYISLVDVKNLTTLKISGLASIFYISIGCCTLVKNLATLAALKYLDWLLHSIYPLVDARKSRIEQNLLNKNIWIGFYILYILWLMSIIQEFSNAGSSKISGLTFLFYVIFGGC